MTELQPKAQPVARTLTEPHSDLAGTSASAVQRLTVALHQASANTQAFIEKFEARNFPNPADRLQLALVCSKLDPVNTLLYFSRFDLKAECDRVTVLKETARVQARSTTIFMSEFKISEPANLEALAAICLRHDAERVLPNLDCFGYNPQTCPAFLQRVIANWQKLATTEPLPRAARSLANLFEQLIPQAARAGLLNAEAALQLQSLEAHQQLLLIYTRLFPDRPQIAQSFCSELRRSKECAMILAGLHLLNLEDPQERPRDLSRQALSKLCGVDLSRSPVFERNPADTYQLLLSVTDSQGSAADLLRTIPAKWWREDPRGMLELLYQCQTLNAAGQDTSEIVCSFALDLQDKGNTAQSRSNLKARIGASLREQLVAAFSGELELEGCQPHAVAELQERWGDISPILILASRFTAQSGRSLCMPVLKEIVLKSLANNFSQYKYGSELQMEIFSDSSKAVWTAEQKPCSLKVISASEGQSHSAAEVCAQVRAIVTSNLLPHMRLEFKDLQRSPIGADQLLHLLEVGDRKAARAAASLMLRAYVEDGGTSEMTPVRQDLQEIVRKLTFQNHSGSRAQLLFSVIVDDARNLLTIGDSVETYSCLNHKYGFLVEALPAYAIDGNIQAALTFALGAGELGRLQGVFIERPEDLIVSGFKPQRLLLELRDKQSGIIQEVYLDKAQRRNILRMGTNFQNIEVLLTERAYYQEHQASRAIEVATAELIERYRRQLGVSEPVPGQVTYFPASRNPMGVYCDASGGIEIGDYIV